MADDQQSTYQVLAYNGRDLPKSYQSLIYSKWLRSLKGENEYFRLIDRARYFKIYSLYIENLINRPHTIVRIAALSSDLDVVLGFSVVEHKVLHYVHVHRDQRGQGIAHALVPKDIASFTHLTKSALRIWPKYPHLIFDPFQ